MRSKMGLTILTVGIGLVLSGCSAMMQKDHEMKTDDTTDHSGEMNEGMTPPDEMMTGEEEMPMEAGEEPAMEEWKEGEHQDDKMMDKDDMGESNDEMAEPDMDDMDHEGDMDDMDEAEESDED